MLELVPCLTCSRHVSVRETTCPFCESSLPLRRARFVVPRGFTRAAVFSAALASCTQAKDNEAKPSGPAVQQGSDDLEKMLDPSAGPGPATPRGAIADAAIADTEIADAAIVDAGVDAAVPVDAGVDAEKKRKRELERKRKQREQEEAVKVPPPREHPIPKPYGAPPARRRVV